jgi:hypothetical protein
MNPEAKAIFDKIVVKNPQDLSKDEIEFIHARRPYLNDEQLRIFKDVIAKRDAEILQITNAQTDHIILDKTPPIYVSKKDQKNARRNK